MIVLFGRHSGEEFALVGNILDVFSSTCIADLAIRGVGAAKDAIKVDKYMVTDAPFYYGTIRDYPYIISHYDLFGETVGEAW